MTSANSAQFLGYLNNFKHYPTYLCPGEPISDGGRKSCLVGICINSLTLQPTPLALLKRKQEVQHYNRAIDTEIRNLTMVTLHPTLSPFFVKYFGVCKGYLVCLRYDGTLMDILTRQITCSTSARIQYSYQSFFALQMLHKYDWVHLDIKPNNIFRLGSTVVLGDLESLRHTDEKDAQSQSGCYTYMPPESIPDLVPTKCSLRPGKKRIARDLKARDVWAMALTVYAVLKGTLPAWAYDLAKLSQSDFAGADEVAKKMGIRPFPKPINDIESFLNEAFQGDHKFRPSAKYLSDRLAFVRGNSIYS